MDVLADKNMEESVDVVAESSSKRMVSIQEMPKDAEIKGKVQDATGQDTVGFTCKMCECWYLRKNYFEYHLKNKHSKKEVKTAAWGLDQIQH